MLLETEQESLSACFFSHSAQLDGAERSLLELVTELTEDHGVLCTVVLPDDGPLRTKLEEAGATTQIINYSWWCDHEVLSENQVESRCSHSIAGLLFNVNQVLSKINPDVIVTNTMVIPWGAIAASFLNKPHIWFVREYGEADHNLKFFMPLKVTLDVIKNLSTYILTNSDAVRKAHFGNVRNKKILTVYPYIDISSTDLAQYEGRSFVKANSVKLIVVGSLHEEKGQKDAILAVKELVRRGRDVELIIMGDCASEYAGHLKSLVAEEGLEAHVEFIGFKSNPYPIINQADIVLVCSRKEAFGRVTVEGMLLKKPVVGTNTGGTPELINDGFNGLLYEPGDYNRLADRLMYLIDHPGEAGRLADNGFEFATRTFTKDKFGGRIYRLLRSLKQESGIQTSSAMRDLKGTALLDAVLTAAAAGNPKISALITEFGSSISIKDSRISSLEEGLQEKASRIDGLEVSLQEKASKIVGLEVSLQEKASRISGLEVSLLEKDSRVAELEVSLQEKDSRISGLEASLQEKDSRISGLEASLQEKVTCIRGQQMHIQQIQQSVVMQLVSRYQRVIEKLLRRGTLRRHYYELSLSGVRVIFNEGWRAFWRRLKSWFRVKSVKSTATFSRPIGKAEPQDGFGQNVDIVVPVYNAFEWTRKCLSAVLSFTVGMQYRLIVVDDASTDPLLLEYLSHLSSRHTNVNVLRNSNNIGFLQSANRGMKFSNNDVVLLNSDAVVTYDWLRKLRDCAYGNKDIATVTPLSNNATVCSVPEPWKNNQIPTGYTIQEFGELVGKEAQGLDVACCEIPVGVGYCMYIKRKIISKIGLFSEEFGRGYQEEVDFCLRASEKGYRNVACPHVFVYHAGTASTNTEQADQDDSKNFNILLKKHPDYQRMWEGFSGRSPLANIQLSVNKSIQMRSVEPLRISIDAQLLSRGQRTGTERNMLGLIDGLMGLDNHCSYTVFTAETSVDQYYHKDARFVRKFALDSADILWDPDFVDGDVFHRTFQCYSAFDLLLLLNARASVISILDLINYHYPDYFPNVQRHKRYQKITKLAATIADQIIAISEHGKKDIIRNLQVPAEKVKVVYPALLDTSRFKKVEDPGVIAGFKTKHGLNNPYILYIATTFPHKNHEGLISAYEHLLNNPACQRSTVPDLVLIAPETHLKRRRIIESRISKLKDKIHLLDYVPDDDLPLFYSCACLFAFPSLYEGFGLPLLEAMACGVPVVASDATSIPEVAGDAALLVDCTQPEQLANAIHSVLIDAGIRNELVEKGNRRIKFFSRAEMLEKTVQIYSAAHQVSLGGRSKLPKDISMQIEELAREDHASIFFRVD